MRRGVVSSLLSILGAFVVATSAAGLAVAHGSAHLHSAEHDQEHGGHLPVNGDHGTSATIEASGHGEHAHLQASAAVTSRTSGVQFVIASVVVLSLGSDIPRAAGAPRAEPLDVPDGPPPDRTTQPRAPPLG